MRRFRRYPSWTVWLACLAAGAVAAKVFWGPAGGSASRSALGDSGGASFQPGEFELVRVVKPDLLLIRQAVPVLGESEPRILEAPLQLLGVRTPLEHEAAEFDAGRELAAELLSAGRPELRFDRRRLNEQGSFLAYVHVDGKLLNAELIRAGYAQADIYPGDNQAVHAAFVQAEREARRAERGIWRKQTP